ncbi:MAG TPA: peptidyl-prolyl cis-trans isomerase [Candidatus Eisenbacteria bacterium]|nr:peptidyl-prolyl cis-trans isomerase [Candidatus Eisenbacteria bacterium]
MLKFLRGSRRTAVIWWLIIFGTAVTFVIGFSVAPNLVGGRQTASATEPIGTVNGKPITVADYDRTLNQIQTTFKAQYNRDPQGRDLEIMKEQAWAQLVTEQAILQQADKMGYGATDDEVLFAVRNTPPPWVRSQEAFQTNGQFDPRKYQSALSNPTSNWAPLEDEMRRMLPGQKLESNLLSTAKFSEPELREAFLDQYEKASVSVARWQPVQGAIDTSKFTDAALRSYYAAHQGRFAGEAQAQAVIVRMVKTVRPEDQAATLDRAKGVMAQLKGGADFAQLARDNSDDPSGAQGGDFGQVVKLSNIGGAMKAKAAAVRDSTVLEPELQGNRYYILKLKRVPDVNGEAAFRAAQIVLMIHPSDESKQADMDKLRKLRVAAGRKGLAAAAADMGLAATTTEWFSLQMMVPSLMALPQAQQFALLAEAGAVSPVYDMEDAWALVQVKDKHPAGPRPFESVRPLVRGAMELEARLAPPMAAAERAAAAIKAGKPFEEAAKAEGASMVETPPPFTRSSPPGSLAGSPRAIGMAFGLPVGQLGGPVQSPIAVILLRKNAMEEAPVAKYDSLKSAISQNLLSLRQNRSFQAWLDGLRDQSTVKDNRGEVLAPQ